MYKSNQTMCVNFNYYKNCGNSNKPAALKVMQNYQSITRVTTAASKANRLKFVMFILGPNCAIHDSHHCKHLLQHSGLKYQVHRRKYTDNIQGLWGLHLKNKNVMQSTIHCTLSQFQASGIFHNTVYYAAAEVQGQRILQT